jgi:hypothetical protein
MMRLAKSITTVSAALVLGLGLAGGAMAQTSPDLNTVQAAAAKTASQATKKPAPAAKPMAPKAPATTPKHAAKSMPNAAPKPAEKVGMTASPDQAPAASTSEPVIAKRDPFVSLVNDRKEVGGPALPPGKAGLVVATVRVDGTVKSGGDLIAVVSNPERHVYFVRTGDQLYDGIVERIDLDGVTFHEDSKDAFGHPVVREVTKRIYATAGEQQ